MILHFCRHLLLWWSDWSNLFFPTRQGFVSPYFLKLRSPPNFSIVIGHNQDYHVSIVTPKKHIHHPLALVAGHYHHVSSGNQTWHWDTPPFTHDFPIETSIYIRFCIAMFDDTGGSLNRNRAIFGGFPLLWRVRSQTNRLNIWFYHAKCPFYRWCPSMFSLSQVIMYIPKLSIKNIHSFYRAYVPGSWYRY